MKVPKELIIIGQARALEYEADKPKGKQKTLLKGPQLGLADWRQDDRYTPQILAVSRDYKKLILFTLGAVKDAPNFKIDKRGKTRGAFHRVNRYYVPTLDVARIGRAKTIWYKSSLFDEPGITTPDEYRHSFDTLGSETALVYADHKTKPRVYMIKNTSGRQIFQPGGAHTIGAPQSGQVELGILDV